MTIQQGEKLQCHFKLCLLPCSVHPVSLHLQSRFLMKASDVVPCHRSNAALAWVSIASFAFFAIYLDYVSLTSFPTLSKNIWWINAVKRTKSCVVYAYLFLAWPKTAFLHFSPIILYRLTELFIPFPNYGVGGYGRMVHSLHLRLPSCTEDIEKWASYLSQTLLQLAFDCSVPPTSLALLHKT